MKIVFGLWADGGAWPDHGGDAAGSLGQPVVGPIGLVDILESQLGLGGPATAQVVRIAHFQSQLESLGGSYFWSRSLAVDSWSTARTLLAWRDDLVGLGWRDDLSWQSPRLADLAAASAAATDLPRGLNDRIVAVLAALDPRAAACQRRSKTRPLGGAKVGHLAASEERREGVARPEFPACGVGNFCEGFSRPFWLDFE